jgi:hypothetical protein
MKAGIALQTFRRLIPIAQWDGLRTPCWLRVRALPDTHRCTDFIVSRQELVTIGGLARGAEVWRSRCASAIAPEARICPVAPRNSDTGRAMYPQLTTRWSRACSMLLRFQTRTSSRGAPPAACCPRAGVTAPPPMSWTCLDDLPCLLWPCSFLRGSPSPHKTILYYYL